jgi:glutathione synthase/RimK-type ligase-like ATP-grasp enzyme
VTRALHALARRGKAGAAAALRLDLWRAGVRGAAEVVEVPGRHELYRELWAAAAARCGAGVEDLGDGFLAIGPPPHGFGGLIRRHGGESVLQNGRQVVVCDNLVPLDDPVRLRLAADKAQSQRLLEQAGLSVAAQASYDIGDLAPARRFLTAHGTCVVKPAANTGAGLGVTCGVRTEADLVRASVRAARWGPALVVEQQAEGDELRVLVLDGRVLGAVRRRPPRVVGDGRSTVAELVTAEHRRRVEARGRAGLWAPALDLDAVLALERQGLSPRAVPAAGRAVEIGATANENGPDDNETVEPPQAVRGAALAAAAVLGLRLASVEVVGDVVVEVNGTPGLHYHAQVADPSGAADVFTPILETLLAQEAQG